MRFTWACCLLAQGAGGTYGLNKVSSIVVIVVWCFVVLVKSIEHARHTHTNQTRNQQVRGGVLWGGRGQSTLQLRQYALFRSMSLNFLTTPFR